MSSHPTRPLFLALALLVPVGQGCSNAEEKGPVTYLDAANGPSGDAAVILAGDDAAGSDQGRPSDAVGPAADAGPGLPSDAGGGGSGGAGGSGGSGGAGGAGGAGGSGGAGGAGGSGDAGGSGGAGGAGGAATPDAATPSLDARSPSMDAAPPPDAGAVPLPCAPAADPRPGQAREVSNDGRFVRFPNFRSEFVASRRLTVRLPPGGVAPDEHLPVLYMHDGQNVFFDEEATFGVSWGAIGTTDDFARAPQGRRLLVVAVDNTDDRMDDYTPVPDPDRMAGGEADNYGRFLVEEVKPFIDFHFPTRCAPEDTGLLGSSLGGLVSLYLGAQYPDIFGRIAAFSPSLWWADGVGFEWSAPLIAALSLSPERRLYLDTGNFEGEPAEGLGSAGRSSVVLDGRLFADEMVAGLAPNAVDQVMLVEDPGAAHDETAWRRRLPGALRFVYGPPLALDTADRLWPWAPVMRAGQSTTASVFAHDDLRPEYSQLGPGARLTLDAQGAVSLDAAGRLMALAPGSATLSRVDPPALSTSLIVAAANESIVHLLVRVPPGSGRTYLGGSLDQFGPWDATGYELRRLHDTLYEGHFAARTGTEIEFKFTQGTWEAVEKADNGADRENRRYTPAGDADVELTVTRWGGVP